MTFATVVKLGDYLYIDGGQISTFVDNNQTNDAESLEFSKTLAIPLNKSWKPGSVEIKEIAYKNDMRATNFAGLWADPNRNAIYRWAGELSRSARYEKGEETEMYMLSVDGGGDGTWSTKKPAQQAAFDKIIPSTHGQSVFCGDLGFYIGGYVWAGSSYGESTRGSPGVRMYNASSSEWYNITDFEPSGPQGNLRNGAAVCILGFGSSPLVMLLGGATDFESGYQSLSFVTIYDPIAQKWYRQDTVKDTNGFPSDREYFCAAPAQGKNGTVEVYMFGGLSSEKRSLDDLWVLSLPAFKWIQLSSTRSSEAIRHMHKCTIAGKRQFISIGGRAKPSKDGFKSDDIWPRGIGIFDLVTSEWVDSYDPSLGEYDSPASVQKIYKSGEADGYNYTPGVQELFWKNRSSNDTTEESQSSGGKVSAGTIAGATVGGVAVVVLIAGGIFWLMRRRRQQDNQAMPLPTEDFKEPNVWGDQPLPPYRQDISGAGVPIIELNSTTVSEMDGCQSPPNRAEGLAELPTPEIGSFRSPSM
ncbi:unnamed protein product [Clonostachys solani]|uniref:Epidermal growth factor receptor-like transmembrane-juxtamembrane segment domain-containing protein n=1 Tax=Clonostachys solani TaxID=160281 RepID=A0A9N9ZDP6_9HYPO|nr:unnamed protein product [Clonostachys solani]